MHKALVMEVDACTGCHQCELMCSYGKVGAFNPGKVGHGHHPLRWWRG